MVSECVGLNPQDLFGAQFLNPLELMHIKASFCAYMAALRTGVASYIQFLLA